MSQFKYRFVRFGTRFTSAAAARINSSAEPAVLHENELAVDVGGVCWGLDRETLPVLDHHFHRSQGQYPSAAAAVLHNAERIGERLGSGNGDVWLVSHQQPDFDAFSAMYLARQVLAGEIPAKGWEQFGIDPDGYRSGAGAIDWFKPRTDHLPPERRWPILLASYAAAVDHCRRMSCPQNRSLHSILYAALERGRDYLEESNGAVEFFDEVRQALLNRELRLNPLFDSVLEGSERFAPELDLLDREVETYRRDISRARKAIVFLQSSTVPFGEWFGEVAKLPLFASSGEPDATHFHPPHQRYSQADGIYLRDPDCLLFKEWVRNDLDNSSMGNGFLFSAIAYSGGRPESGTNSLAYFFSIDPERAGRRHLYNVWAQLESAEVKALRAPEQTELWNQLRAAEDGSKTACRAGFAERAGPELRHCFDDPWFDGSNYHCTIVATPNRGTLIGEPGRDSDLADDPVARIVQHELEHSVFVGDLTAYDMPPVPRPLGEPLRFPVSSFDMPETYCAVAGRFRFASIELREDVEILEGQVAEQIGRTLWRFLEPEAGTGVPTDFLERHLFRATGWLGVWSRRGIIVAFKSDMSKKIVGFRDVFAELIALAEDLQKLVEAAPTAEGSEQIVAESHRLTRRLAVEKHTLSLPENRLLGRFFEASRLDEVLEMLRDVNEAAVERVRTARSDATLSQIRDLNSSSERSIKESIELQGKVEWLEVFFFAVYIAELIHIVGDSLHFNGQLVGFGALTCSIIAGALAYHVLNPKEHVKLHRLSAWVWIAAFAVLAGFLILGKLMDQQAIPVHIKEDDRKATKPSANGTPSAETTTATSMKSPALAGQSNRPASPVHSQISADIDPASFAAIN
ncbi:MAG TPA: hypothetical protein VGY55_13055 [Pirellulales bacterium]|jgi:hypothetical protein|nr:hypothetical protein [Pirellulales bacterium]